MLPLRSDDAPERAPSRTTRVPLHVAGSAMMAPMIPTASTLSDVPEHRRKDDHDNRRPHGIDRQVIRLPPFEEREQPTPAEEAHVERGGPGKVDEQDHVLAQRGHAVGAEAELGDSRGYGPQRYRVSQQRTDHQHDLEHIE